jgi:hypothetical protein
MDAHSAMLPFYVSFYPEKWGLPAKAIVQILLYGHECKGEVCPQVSALERPVILNQSPHETATESKSTLHPTGPAPTPSLPLGLQHYYSRPGPSVVPSLD